MPVRPNTDGAVGTALDGPTLNVAYILRLDIVSDPLFAWTGFGDLTFTAGQTGDAALDGFTFGGITHLIADISAVEDSHGGSGGIEIALPGIDLTDEAMRQVVYDRRKWQFKPAWLWLVFLDEAGAVIGKPVRLRSGKMDQMIVEEADDGSTGTVKCMIESQQAYASEASATRYSEQTDIDPADTSQKYVWQLANLNPQIGQKYGLASSGGGGGSGGGSGSRGGGSRLPFGNNTRNR